MSTQLNMKFRSDVLESALMIENQLNTLLLWLLRIEDKTSRTLSGKSSSLSFKNKIDLLFDLKMLKKKDYAHLLFFMEIRNQVVHNFGVNSFEKVFDWLQSNKAKKLLEFYPLDKKTTLKTMYELSFGKFATKAMDILIDGIDKVKDQLIDENNNKIKLIEHEFNEKLIKALSDSIDEVFAEVDKIIDKPFTELPSLNLGKG
ncbi:MAG: hypothetical protein DHS20C17_05340 [Cyclobacteriaceae bacterium]|nr:MAG: hypothetical protein DHS20C17_05340 [Cyclobacteriaceae bacterium]